MTNCGLHALHFEWTRFEAKGEQVPAETLQLRTVQTEGKEHDFGF